MGVSTGGNIATSSMYDGAATKRGGTSESTVMVLCGDGAVGADFVTLLTVGKQRCRHDMIDEEGTARASGVLVLLGQTRDCGSAMASGWR